MATEFKYWAFISYSHADKKWGDWLLSALETFKVPKPLAGAESRSGEALPRRIFPIFRDREELPTSSDLGSMITQALQQSRCLIVICSPRAAKSHWVNQEILDFKRLGGAERILALIVDGEPNAADGKPGFSVEAECFPEAMKYALGADGTLDKNQPTEPIAADARPGMDGRTNAKLKLVAGILGINYDDLKRREERRRRRQQRIVVTVSTALVLSFASLAAVAFWQRSIAKKETVEANTQKQEAEKQKTEAITQKHAADTQKAIAEEKSVEAENEKEQVETQTAADEEDLAREALLRGDPLTAAQHLSLAYEAQPQDAAVRLLLHTAMSDLNGLATVLNGSSGTFTNMEVSPESGLVLTVTSDGEAQVWNPQKNVPVLIFGKSGNLYNQVHAASFTPDGKGVLLSNDSETFLEDIATGKKVPLSPGPG
ncbi:MAG: TIR domain-containing protein, partial [Terracidiphilus sp.]